jgi:hypothetical protein
MGSKLSNLPWCTSAFGVSRTDLDQVVSKERDSPAAIYSMKFVAMYYGLLVRVRCAEAEAAEAEARDIYHNSRCLWTSTII